MLVIYHEEEATWKVRNQEELYFHYKDFHYKAEDMEN